MRGPNGFGSDGRRELAPPYVGISAVFESMEDENWHPRMLGFQLFLSRVRRLLLVLLSVMRSDLIVSVLFFSFFLLVCGYEDKHARAHTRTHARTHARTHTDERERERSSFYYTKIKSLSSCLFLQTVPANLHASRLHTEHQYAKH